MDEIKCFIISNKALGLINNKKYSFLVSRSIDKNKIKNIIELFFGIKVIAVNTFNFSKQKNKNTKFTGYKTIYKKAIVTIHSKDSISLFLNI
jgi:large subunit ribosomal protein L23